MSIVMPHSDAQSDEWRSRGPEPIELELPGWAVRTVAGPLPNERCTTWTLGQQWIQLTRYWDYPLHPGGPMVTASKRTIQVRGEPLTIVRTSVFVGLARDVEVVHYKGRNWYAHLVFERCPEPVVDAACAAVRIR